MKYNYDIKEMEGENSSFWKILKQIKPGSTVLECGCATGYMTRYMKEKLDCKVYIVEYEQAAFDIANHYATDGICTDLTKDEWVVKFAGIKFDYVLFPDVLEHLNYPVDVLKKAKTLCKQDGTILVSLPNVCHNDILLNMYNDNWNYTSLGLLDETHLRFWGLNNISNFFLKANLKIVNLDCTIVPMLCTEQKIKINTKNDLLHNALLSRDRGEVYQYIVTAKDIDDTVNEFNVDDLLCTLCGSNYKSTLSCVYNKMEKPTESYIKLKSLSSVHQRYQLENKKIEHIEYQLIDLPFVIVTSIIVESNIGNIDTKILGGCKSIAGDLFVDTCPKYEILVSKKDVEWIVIKAEFFHVNEIGNFSNLVKDYAYINLEKDKQYAEIKEKETEIKDMLNSKSWKITKPLRWLRRIFKHGNSK